MIDSQNPGPGVVADRHTSWLRPELKASWIEIALVAAAVVGLSASISAWQAAHGSSQHYVADLITNVRMIRSLAIESAILSLLFVHLKRRGWTAADLNIRPGWWGSGQALGLLLAMIAANSFTVAALYTILFEMQSRYSSFVQFVLVLNGNAVHPQGAAVSWWALLSACTLNGFYEEITCIGYLFRQFAAKHGLAFALILTVMLRMSCHTYQGPVHALGIGVAFTASGLVYCWTRNLWPLILSHIVLDAMSLGLIKLLHP